MSDIREKIEKVLLNSGHYNRAAKDILDDSNSILSIVREAVEEEILTENLMSQWTDSYDAQKQMLSRQHSTLIEVLK